MVTVGQSREGGEGQAKVFAAEFVIDVAANIEDWSSYGDARDRRVNLQPAPIAAVDVARVDPAAIDAGTGVCVGVGDATGARAGLDLHLEMGVSAHDQARRS